MQEKKVKRKLSRENCVILNSSSIELALIQNL